MIMASPSSADSGLLLKLLAEDPSPTTAANVVRYRLLTSRDAVQDEIFHRATQTLLATLDAAARLEELPLQNILGSDQVCILHAILLLRQRTQDCRTPQLLNNYRRILLFFEERGVSIFGNADSRPIARAIYAQLTRRSQQHGPQFSDEELDAQPCRHLEEYLIQGFTPSNCLSFAIALRENRCCIDTSTGLLKSLFEGSLLSSARRRNFSDAGLLWLAYKLVFPKCSLPFFVEWASRIRRSDGLWGPWQLFDGLISGANLSASVNMSWSFSDNWPLPNACTSSVRSALSVDSIATTEIDNSINSMKAWIESAVPQFQLGSLETESDYGDRIKPFVELVLCLWLIGSNRFSCDQHALWARRQAADILPALTEERYVEALRIFPTTVLAALAFPMIEDLAGTNSPFHNEVISIVESGFSISQERLPMRQMDYWFLRELLDPTSSAVCNALNSSLERTLLHACENPGYFSNDSLYDITHAIFYATRFGRERRCLPPRCFEWCENYIPMLCLSMVLEGDFDLGAEFIMNWVQLGLERDERFWFAVHMLMSAILPNGSLPGPRRIDKYESLTEFERDYHTTLVGLAALIAVRRAVN